MRCHVSLRLWSRLLRIALHHSRFFHGLSAVILTLLIATCKHGERLCLFFFHRGNTSLQISSSHTVAPMVLEETRWSEMRPELRRLEDSRMGRSPRLMCLASSSPAAFRSTTAPQAPCPSGQSPEELLRAASSMCTHVTRDNIISNSKHHHHNLRRRPSFEFSARPSTKLKKSNASGVGSHPTETPTAITVSDCHTLVPAGILRAAKSACGDNLSSNGIYDHQTSQRRPSFEFQTASRRSTIFWDSRDTENRTTSWDTRDAENRTDGVPEMRAGSPPASKVPSGGGEISKGKQWRQEQKELMALFASFQASGAAVLASSSTSLPSSCPFRAASHTPCSTSATVCARYTLAPAGLLGAAKSMCAHVTRDNLISNSKDDHQPLRRRPSFEFPVRRATV